MDCRGVEGVGPGPKREVLRAHEGRQKAVADGTGQLGSAVFRYRTRDQEGVTMRLTRVIRQRIRSLFRRADLEREMHEEIALHLEQLEREHRASGMSDRETHAAARRAFGSVDLWSEECR